MMDKKPHIKPYLYGMFAGFGAISLSILFFFLIYRFQGFGNAVSTLTGILMPFIYGSVIAYLLKPVCNWLEAFLHKLFPEKMHRFANMLAVALTILFGLLLIYALIMMIVPQLINSVTALYFTARDNIGDFVGKGSGPPRIFPSGPPRSRRCGRSRHSGHGPAWHCSGHRRPF